MKKICKVFPKNEEQFAMIFANFKEQLRQIETMRKLNGLDPD